MKQHITVLEGKTDKSTLIVQDFNTPFPVIDGRIRQKIRRAKKDLNDTNSQLDLIHIYGTFYHQQQNTHCLQTCT